MVNLILRHKKKSILIIVLVCMIIFAFYHNYQKNILTNAVIKVEESEKEEETKTDIKKEIALTYHLEGKDDDYFDNSLFIGDSRMVGIKGYSLLEKPIVLSQVSLTINKLNNNIFKEYDQTAFEVISKHNFDKIFISFGINELGWYYPDVFQQKYQNVIKKIKKLTPNTQIIVLLMYPVALKNNLSLDGISQNVNDRIQDYNDLIITMCEQEQVYYIHDYNKILDDSGNLRQELCEDGVHLSRQGYQEWLDILKHSWVKGK